MRELYAQAASSKVQNGASVVLRNQHDVTATVLLVPPANVHRSRRLGVSSPSVADAVQELHMSVQLIT